MCIVQKNIHWASCSIRNSRTWRVLVYTHALHCDFEIRRNLRSSCYEFQVANPNSCTEIDSSISQIELSRVNRDLNQIAICICLLLLCPVNGLPPNDDDADIRATDISIDELVTQNIHIFIRSKLQHYIK